jgi:hypothetical protein
VHERADEEVAHAMARTAKEGAHDAVDQWLERNGGPRKRLGRMEDIDTDPSAFGSRINQSQRRLRLDLKWTVTAALCFR